MPESRSGNVTTIGRPRRKPQLSPSYIYINKNVTHISGPSQTTAHGHEPAPPYPGMKPGGIAERAWLNVMRSRGQSAHIAKPPFKNPKADDH